MIFPYKLSSLNRKYSLDTSIYNNINYKINLNVEDNVLHTYSKA